MRLGKALWTILSLCRVCLGVELDISWIHPLPSAALWSPTVLHFLPGASGLQIVAATSVGGIALFDSHGHFLPEFSFLDRSLRLLQPLIADVDQDGLLDIVALDERGVLTILCQRLHGLQLVTEARVTAVGSKALAPPVPVPLSEDGWLVLLLDDGSQSLSVALLSLASLNVVQELVVPEKRGRTRQRQPTVADLDGDGVYEAVFGTGSGRIYAVSLDPAEMKVKKTWMADAAVEGELAIGEFGPGGEPLLVAVDVQGKVYGFEMRTESRKWIVELRGRSSQDIVAYYDERVGRWSLFVVYEAGRVCRIDLSTGEILRQWKFGTRIMSAVTPFQMTRDVVGFAFCGKDGILYVVSEDVIETLDLGESCSASVVYTDLAGEGFVELIVSTLKGSIISVQTDLILNRRDYLSMMFCSSCRKNSGVVGMVAESQTDLLGRSQNLVLELGFQGSFQNDSAVFIAHLGGMTTLHRKVLSGSSIALPQKLPSKPGDYIVLIEILDRFGQPTKSTSRVTVNVHSQDLFTTLIIFPLIFTLIFLHLNRPNT